MPITEWDSLSHCIALFAAANMVADAKPQSPLLVGPPAQGKSSCVKRFKHWPGIDYAADISISGLHALLASRESVRVLILDELQRVVSHSRETVFNICGAFLSLMSGDGGKELVGPSGTGSRVDYSKRQLALFAAIPWDVYLSRQQDFASTGLLSRFTTLSVVRSQGETRRVQSNILDASEWKGRGDNPYLVDLKPYPIPAKMPRELTTVSLTHPAKEKLKEWVLRVMRDGDDRRIVMCVTLAKAVALLNGRNETTVGDVKTLMLFEKYLASLQYNRITNPQVLDALPVHPNWYEVPNNGNGKHGSEIDRTGSETARPVQSELLG